MFPFISRLAPARFKLNVIPRLGADGLRESLRVALLRERHFRDDVFQNRLDATDNRNFPAVAYFGQVCGIHSLVLQVIGAALCVAL